MGIETPADRSMGEVCQVDPCVDERWDRFVRSHPQATVYHLAAWSQILSRSYRFRPRYLALQGSGGDLRGVLPLVSRRGLLTGLRMRSLPAIEIGGPLGVDSAAEGELVAAACEEARRLKCRLTVDSTRPLPGESGGGMSWVSRPPSWIADVPGADAYEDWLAARSSNVRRGIKRARSREVEVRLAESEDDLRRFYRLYLSTMRKHRSLPRSWRQLALARTLLGQDVFRLFLAEHEGRAVAGGVFHEFGGSLELLYNGSDDGALDLRPNHALYAEVVRWAGERGLRSFDHGYAWPGSSLAAFKQQWGATPVARYRYGSSPVAGRDPDRADRESRVRKAVEKVWGKAPLALTQAGAVLAYRYL